MPSQHKSWNHLTRSAASITTAIQSALASKLEKGTDTAPSPSVGDVVLDVCMGAHYEVELERGALAVGVEGPSSGTRGTGTSCAGHRVQRLLLDNATCPAGNDERSDELQSPPDGSSVSRSPSLVTAGPPALDAVVSRMAARTWALVRGARET